jgi:transcriptional regulator with XRE-family HTH domain
MSRPGKRTAAQITLGQRARTQRLQLGLSQMALAERIGLHFTFVSSVERGERNLSLSSLLRLAEGLEVNPACKLGYKIWMCCLCSAVRSFG